MAISSNLPPIADSSSSIVTSFFDGYFSANLSYPVELIGAVVGFFEKAGFDLISANSTAIILLQQAQTDTVDVFQLLDTLKKLTTIQLSAVVAEVLNYNRQKSSVLGFKQSDNTQYLDQRNILI